MKVQNLPPQGSPPKLPLQKHASEHTDHWKDDGLQLGHDLADVGEHGLKSRWLSELAHDEMLEMRGLVASEGRQTAVLGETAHYGNHSWLQSGVGVLNGAVAVGAVWHGLGMLRSKDPLRKVDGVNHLLMGAGCGLVSAHLLGGSHELAGLGSKFLIAHGVGEVAVGSYRAATGKSVLPGLLQATHGACLVGAEMVPGAALPLCVAMAGVTAAQIWLHNRKPVE